MNKALAFDDVLITPSFSSVFSRKDVSLSQDFLGIKLDSPIISANMDTITESEMANALRSNGAVGALHRFSTIERNVEMFLTSPKETFVSVGINVEDLKRAEALYEAGARNYIIDIAHAASLGCVRQYLSLRELLPQAKIVVGNFATYESVRHFLSELGPVQAPDAIKVGVGSGAMCTTRIVTGCGLPTLASLLTFPKDFSIPLIADGGMKTSGDIAKALAAGARCVMVGSLLAGTYETPGDLITQSQLDNQRYGFSAMMTSSQKDPIFKTYRGSASQESYVVQDKIEQHRTAEGESTLVPFKGPVKNVLDNLNAGLRSALSYVGAHTLEDFRENAELVQITQAGHVESRPHGKN